MPKLSLAPYLVETTTIGGQFSTERVKMDLAGLSLDAGLGKWMHIQLRSTTVIQ